MMQIRGSTKLNSRNPRQRPTESGTSSMLIPGAPIHRWPLSKQLGCARGCRAGLQAKTHRCSPSSVRIIGDHRARTSGEHRPRRENGSDQALRARLAAQRAMNASVESLHAALRPPAVVVTVAPGDVAHLELLGSFASRPPCAHSAISSLMNLCFEALAARLLL
jgi:hypothetical protein